MNLTPLNPVLWSMLCLTPSGIYLAEINPNGSVLVGFFPSMKNCMLFTNFCLLVAVIMDIQKNYNYPVHVHILGVFKHILSI